MSFQQAIVRMCGIRLKNPQKKNLLSFGLTQEDLGHIRIMDRKKRLRYPHTHQTRQQWTAKDVEKNRVSFKIITQNNKNVIFIGFDGLFDLRRPQESKKKH